MANYCTIVEAQTYFDGRLGTDAWDSATDTEKTKALTMATRAIDRLNYIGIRNSSSQDNQFPRFDDTSYPQDIMDACAELALALLDGLDPEFEYEMLRITKSEYDKIKSTYNKSTPVHILAGIPSITAWRFLVPYLRDQRSIDVNRVS